MAPNENEVPTSYPQPVKLVTAKSDIDRAAEIRAAAMPHLTALCVLMEEAKRDGLNLNWQLALDPFGRMSVSRIDIVKPIL